jgi:hypothetical protein
MTKRDADRSMELADRLGRGMTPEDSGRHRIKVSMTVAELRLIIEALTKLDR